MKRVYELDVYKLVEVLSDVEKFGPQLNAFINSTKHEGQISNFYFLISTFRERLRIG